MTNIVSKQEQAEDIKDKLNSLLIGDKMEIDNLYTLIEEYNVKGYSISFNEGNRNNCVRLPDINSDMMHVTYNTCVMVTNSNAGEYIILCYSGSRGFQVVERGMVEFAPSYFIPLPLKETDQSSQQEIFQKALAEGLYNVMQRELHDIIKRAAVEAGIDPVSAQLFECEQNLLSSYRVAAQLD